MIATKCYSASPTVETLSNDATTEEVVRAINAAFGLGDTDLAADLATGFRLSLLCKAWASLSNLNWDELQQYKQAEIYERVRNLTEYKATKNSTIADIVVTLADYRKEIAKINFPVKILDSLIDRLKPIDQVKPLHYFDSISNVQISCGHNSLFDTYRGDRSRSNMHGAGVLHGYQDFVITDWWAELVGEPIDLCITCEFITDGNIRGFERVSTLLTEKRPLMFYAQHRTYIQVRLENVEPKLFTDRQLFIHFEGFGVVEIY